MNDVKRRRIINFAIGILKQFGTNALIDFVNHDLIDLKIETAGDKSCGFYIVTSTNDITVDNITALLASVRRDSVIEYLDGHPLYLLIINETDFTLSISPLVIDDCYNTRVIDKISPQIIDNESFARHIDELRRLCHQIEILDKNNIYVVKTFTLDKDSYGRDGNAQLIYLRKMSNEYKMLPKPNNTYLDKFNRCVLGHEQDEYPNDMLDDAIFSAIHNKYPHIRPAHNSLLFATSEIRALLRYRNYFHDFAEFRFLPDISSIPIDLYPYIGKLEGLRFEVDLFILIRNPSNLFSNEGFEARYDLSTWASTLMSLCRELTSLKKVSTLFEEIK